MGRVSGIVELLNRPVRAVEAASQVAAARSGSDLDRRATEPGGGPAVQFSYRLSAALGSYFAAESEAQEAVSVGQIAVRGLSSVRETLVQMQVLSLQASREPISSGERLDLLREFRLLVEDLHETLQATRWRGRSLLTGAEPPRELSVGGNSLVIALPRVETARLRDALERAIEQPTAARARSLAETVGQTNEQVERDARALGAAIEVIQASYSSLV